MTFECTVSLPHIPNNCLSSNRLFPTRYNTIYCLPFGVVGTQQPGMTHSVELGPLDTPISKCEFYFFKWKKVKKW